MSKKTIALILAILMALGCVSATAEVSKQEKIYVVSGADGNVSSVTDVIRLENPDSLDVVTDRTMLTGIESLSGKETFTLKDGVLTWQADGHDIVYQGRSDKLPAVVPAVTITLDGKTVSAAELKEKEGEAVLTVSYQVNEAVPALAVTAMLLPEAGVSGLQAENASVVTEMGRQLLVGFAVPGADPALNLPSSFTASFHADHVELNWMMTAVTSDPVRSACEAVDGSTETDLSAALADAGEILAAMSRNEELPETDGKAKDLVLKLKELNDGLIGLDDGAKQLADGAKALYGGKLSADETPADAENAAEASGTVALADGASALESGLALLTENNKDLNQGAIMIFSAILDTANAQIASSGLDAAGITIPALSAENYAAVLDAAIAQLDPETLKTAAYAQVEAAVRAQVEANEAQIRVGVEQAVQAKVLEAVLGQLNLSLTADQYDAAVKAGKITADQAAKIDAAVKAQLSSEEVRAKIDAAVLEKKEELVSENTEAYLASDEAVQAKLAEAQTASDSLKALKTQLDQVNAFVTGLKAYTDGTAQAAEGAAKLNAGIVQLKDGAKQLASGADNLHANGTSVLKASVLKAEADLAGVLLPYVQDTLPEALRIFEETLNLTRNAHYDLAPEGMPVTTLYLIRTDL